MNVLTKELLSNSTRTMLRREKDGITASCNLSVRLRCSSGNKDYKTKRTEVENVWLGT